MSRDGFDGEGPGPDDGRGWREPEHLGQGHDHGQGQGQGPGPGPGDEPNRAGEQPMPAQDAPMMPPPVPGRRLPGELDRVFRYQGDQAGIQEWGLQQGWTASDGTGPQDAVLAELVASAPVRATKDHRPAGVLRGRFGSLELVAFDVVYSSGRYLVPQWAVTAAPLLVPVPGFRLSPARFWKHRVGGLMHLPSGDPEFDSRWILLASEDSPALRALVADPGLRGLLLGSDDGDEFWSAAGHVCAIRPDGHRPQLLEHHGRLLAAVVGALMSGV